MSSPSVCLAGGARGLVMQLLYSRKVQRTVIIKGRKIPEHGQGTGYSGAVISEGSVKVAHRWGLPACCLSSGWSWGLPSSGPQQPHTRPCCSRGAERRPLSPSPCICKEAALSH